MDREQGISESCHESSSSSSSMDSGRQKPEAKSRSRVKTGCITCRIRRVKCDEGKPACKRCTSTGRKCDGYAGAPVSRRDLAGPRRDLPIVVKDKRSLLLPAPRMSSSRGFANSMELLYFDFFCSKTAPGTNQFLKSDFWQKLVLQLTHHEPSVKYAVLAISGLHQQWDKYGTSAYEVSRTAMAHYSKGIGEAKKMLNRTQAGSSARKEDVERVLVACILFTCFENLIGDYSRAELHLSNGLQILASEGVELSARGQNTTLERSIVELLYRFDFQAMTFSQAQYPLRRAAVRFETSQAPLLPTRFDSLSDVRIFLFEQVNWALSVAEVLSLSRLGIRQHSAKDPYQMHAEAKIEHARTIVSLASFWELVEEYVDRACTPSDPDFRSQAAYAYLRVYYGMASLLTRVGCTGLESSWDEYIPEMANLVDYLDYLQKIDPDAGDSKIMKPSLDRASGHPKSPLSLEVGICVPAYLIGGKCRDPQLRRRVVSILEADHRKEGIWESLGAARVVERLYQLEEKAAQEALAPQTGAAAGSVPPPIVSAADIPEEARVQVCWTTVDMPKRRVGINCRFCKGGWDDGVWSSVYEILDF